jgi:hypothetical protein
MTGSAVSGVTACNGSTAIATGYHAWADSGLGHDRHTPLPDQHDRTILAGLVIAERRAAATSRRRRAARRFSNRVRERPGRIARADVLAA